MQIGKIIYQKLKEKERSIAWLARQINCNAGNLSRTLNNSQHIHSELLLRISIALEEDFFAYYSNIIKESCKKRMIFV